MSASERVPAASSGYRRMLGFLAEVSCCSQCFSSRNMTGFMNRLDGTKVAMPAQLETRDFSSGDTHGQWTLISRIGYGGNGQVWAAENKDGIRVALKLLTKRKAIAHARFADEVKIMESCGLDGVVPIVDSYTPEFSTKIQAWYAMPIGQSLVDYSADKNVIDKVILYRSIADTLVELHELEVTHRDIKPANILVIDNKAYLGDFGLVDYPDKDDLTMSREELGARWTMAPEIRRTDTIENSKPSDVYALMKSLWITITGVQKGYDGRYDESEAISIKLHMPNGYLTPLEELLRDSSEHLPHLRPGMREVRDRLGIWLDMQSEFETRNPLEWNEAKKRLFPISAPKRAIWTTCEAIVRVLNIIGPRTNINHLFFPNGGGLDLEHAALSHREPGCIELTCDGCLSIVNPSELHFESFGSDDDWDYFRLECNSLTPSGVYPEVSARGYEDVLDLGKCRYVKRAYWDDGEYNGEQLPDGSMLITRFFHGAFVIFQKTSTYNYDSKTYDGRHSRMTSEEFREYIERNSSLQR